MEQRIRRIASKESREEAQAALERIERTEKEMLQKWSSSGLVWQEMLARFVLMSFPYFWDKSAYANAWAEIFLQAYLLYLRILKKRIKRFLKNKRPATIAPTPPAAGGGGLKVKFDY